MAQKPQTILTHTGRPVAGPVNRPVQRGSTVAFRSLAAFQDGVHAPDLRSVARYGRVGNPNSHDFEQVMTDLDGGYGAVTAPSGLAIISTALLAFTRPGDHILVTDTVYGPVRRFCDQYLALRGVQVEYYDPLIGGGIAARLKDNTRLVYLESPGSKTFEVQDVPALVKAAKAQNILTLMDNTWATPLFFQPLAHGVDISLQAATKYLGGHSDLFLGVAVCADKDRYLTLKQTALHLGQCASPDDLVLALRGLRTLDVRLRRHEKNARAVIDWLQQQPAVARILWPALAGSPGHDVWKRDFSGASGLFSLILKPLDGEALRRFIDGLEYFPLGYSWGGYESLMVPLDLGGERTATMFKTDGPGLRLHIGLEDPADLIADLAAGFARMKG